MDYKDECCFSVSMLNWKIISSSTQKKLLSFKDVCMASSFNILHGAT